MNWNGSIIWMLVTDGRGYVHIAMVNLVLKLLLYIIMLSFLWSCNEFYDQVTIYLNGCFMLWMFCVNLLYFRPSNWYLCSCSPMWIIIVSQSLPARYPFNIHVYLQISSISWISWNFKNIKCLALQFENRMIYLWLDTNVTQAFSAHTMTFVSIHKNN
jgi:hypothetical protein